MQQPNKHLMVDIQDLSRANEYALDLARTTLVRELLKKNEWAHVKLALRMFTITLQQRIRTKKALLQELKRQVDDMNIAGRVDNGGRIEFQLEHNKKLFGKDTVQLYCIVRQLPPGAAPSSPSFANQPQGMMDVVSDPSGSIGDMSNQMQAMRLKERQLGYRPDYGQQGTGYGQDPEQSRLGALLKSSPPSTADVGYGQQQQQQQQQQQHVQYANQGMHQAPVASNDDYGEDADADADGYMDARVHAAAGGYEHNAPQSPRGYAPGPDEQDDRYPPQDIRYAGPQQPPVTLYENPPGMQQSFTPQRQAAISQGSPMANISPTMRREMSPLQPFQQMPGGVPPGLQSPVAAHAPSQEFAYGAEPRPVLYENPPPIQREEEPAPVPKPRPRPQHTFSQNAVGSGPMASVDRSASMVSRTSGASVPQVVAPAPAAASAGPRTAVGAASPQGVAYARTVEMDAPTLEHCRFFHTFREDQSRHERRQLVDSLMEDRKDGDWLLRYNTDNTAFILVVRFRGRTLHIPIQHNRDTDTYQIHDLAFKNVPSLLNYYHNHPLSSQINVTLNEPVDAVVEDTSGYFYMAPR